MAEHLSKPLVSLQPRITLNGKQKKMSSSGWRRADWLQIAPFDMYLIDTDILIWVLRGDKKNEDFLQNLKNRGSLSISTITIAEVYKNIFPSEIVKTENVLNEFQVWDVTATIAKQGGLYWQQYAKQLKNLSLTDCLIAGTANVNSVTLVSLNSKHFPMKDIKLISP